MIDTGPRYVHTYACLSDCCRLVFIAISRTHTRRRTYGQGAIMERIIPVFVRSPAWLGGAYPAFSATMDMWVSSGSCCCCVDDDDDDEPPPLCDEGTVLGAAAGSVVAPTPATYARNWKRNMPCQYDLNRCAELRAPLADLLRGYTFDSILVGR